MLYIDTHSHLHFEQYAEDREAVLGRMRDQEVATIAVGVDFKTSREAVALAHEYPDVVLGATVGVHPNSASEGFEPAHYAGLFETHAVPGARGFVVGIGECGFDYFRVPRAEVYEREREVFEAQIAFAVESDLPLMLHVRPSKGSEGAHEDALAILRAAQKVHGEKVRGSAHFFTASLAIAKQYWNMGFTVAIPGVVTFAPEMHEVVRAAPLEMILSETDAPYASPVPYRGSRNEPAYVVEVVHTIASIRGAAREKVREQLALNAARVFGIAL